MLYLCVCIDVPQQPLLTQACKWRWVAQPSFSYNKIYSKQGENLFEDSTGKPCWVFETDIEINGFETAPSTYPNGEMLIDTGFDSANSWMEFTP